MVGLRPSCAAVASPHQRAVRWADIGDASDSEGEEDALLAVPPSVDDSYREPPLAALEDSRSGLNRRLAGSAGLGEAMPQDFAFLLSSSTRASPDASEDVGSSASSTAWRPNVHAPEFIPTLSCPSVGICHIGGTCMEPAAALLRRSSQAGPFTTPEKSCRASSPGPSAERKRKGGGKRRRRSSDMQDPFEKRSRSAEKEQALAPPALPDASEDDWRRREEVRKKAVDMIKKFPEYQWYADSKPREEREAGAPTTPDPRDRTISKRKWKYLTTSWRLALKQRYTDEGHGSVVSTEEWQSIMTTLSTEAAEGPAAVDGDDGVQASLPLNCPPST